MAEFYLLLLILPVSADCSVTLEGSCSVTHDGAKDRVEIIIKELIVKANISSHALDALLIPLVVQNMKLKNCAILNEEDENNTFTTPQKVIDVLLENL